jgi:dipeptidase E
MKNVILFSSTCADRKLNNRVNDWLYKHGKNRRVAVIPSYWEATTNSYPPYWAARMGFKEYVICPVGVNFDKKRWEYVLKSDCVFLDGGCTPEFWAMLKLRGLDDDLRKFANRGLLMGMSAGSHIISPTIELSLVADENYLNLSGDELNSLGLTDFLVKPHAGGWLQHKELFRNYATKYNKPVYMIDEGQAVWVCDHGIREYGGHVTKFLPYKDGA